MNADHGGILSDEQDTAATDGVSRDSQGRAEGGGFQPPGAGEPDAKEHDAEFN